MNLVDIVFVIALVLIAGMSLDYSRQIKTDRVPMQWGFDSAPTWFAPRLVGLWFAPFFLFGGRLLIVLLQTYCPGYVHGADMGIVVLSVAAVCGHIIHMRGAARWAARQ